MFYNGYAFTLFLALILMGCREAQVPGNTVFEDILWTVNWSPDGRLIAAGGNHDSLYVYSGKEFKQLKSIPIGNTITKLKWHPSGTFFVTGDYGELTGVEIIDGSRHRAKMEKSAFGTGAWIR